MSDFFRLRENKTTIKREILAGATTFFTVAYVLLLIPSFLSDTGMPFGPVLVASALLGAYSSFLMGVLANYPFVLGPGVSLCVYFTYSVVLAQERNWETALGILFLTGVLLLLLNLLRIRQLIIQVIPLPIRLATTGGLGLLIAFIGLKNAGIVIQHPVTFLTFSNPGTLIHALTVLGIVVMGVMLVFRVPGALFLGILFIWGMGLAFGRVEWNGLVSMPSSILPTLFKLDVVSAFKLEHVGLLISFLFVALFDSTGSLIGLAEEAGIIKRTDSKTKTCHFPHVTRAIMPDTTGTILASLLGTTSAAVYLESAAGISMGGKTGLTALTASFLFLLALFFTPFATSIPHFATAPALVVIGGMMLKSVGKLNWEDPSEWIPAFATLILIPLTFSIAIGIAVGYITYCLIKLLSGKSNDVHWLSWILAFLFILKFIFFPAH